jgi:hypothetical protein
MIGLGAVAPFAAVAVVATVAVEVRAADRVDPAGMARAVAPVIKLNAQNGALRALCASALLL